MCWEEGGAAHQEAGPDSQGGLLLRLARLYPSHAREDWILDRLQELLVAAHRAVLCRSFAKGDEVIGARRFSRSGTGPDNQGTGMYVQWGGDLIGEPLEDLETQYKKPADFKDLILRGTEMTRDTLKLVAVVAAVASGRASWASTSYRYCACTAISTSATAPAAGRGGWKPSCRVSADMPSFSTHLLPEVTKKMPVHGQATGHMRQA